ncbi:sigma-70 family RNA polymerase sigma factor [bacterium]|nr:sigma-70 family RNA polymerase sigma factor [bacterium]
MAVALMAPVPFALPRVAGRRTAADTLRSPAAPTHRSPLPTSPSSPSDLPLARSARRTGPGSLEGTFGKAERGESAEPLGLEPPAQGSRPDEDLVQLCQQASTADSAERESAFRELVERYQERAYWIAKGMVGNADDARDVAQEAFVRVFRSVDRFDPKLKFYTWFYQIVVNLGIDHLRRSKKRTRLSIEDLGENGEGQIEGKSEAPHKAVERDETRRRVLRVLDELPAKYRSVIVLRDLEGFDGREVASIAGATHATVRWRLHKARQMFRAAWERVYGGQP